MYILGHAGIYSIQEFLPGWGSRFPIYTYITITGKNPGEGDIRGYPLYIKPWHV